MDLSLALPAFIAGLITFLAPCTLPLVPAYLGFISNVDPKELNNPNTAGLARRKIFINGALFILGFSIIFILFGMLAGFAGQALVPFRTWLIRIGGVFVILFGLFMLGVFNLPFLQAEKRIKMPTWIKRGNPFGSFAIGGTFALGWTPCIGPILGSILLIASTSTTAVSGGILLAIFSAGLAIPFLLIALLFSRATKLIEKSTKYLKWTSIIGGVFLLLLGFLLLFDKLGLTIQYGYELFDFLNYEEILNFL